MRRGLTANGLHFCSIDNKPNMTFNDGSALSAVRGHYSSCLPRFPTRAHPTPKNQPKAFWTAGQREILFHKCSPWDFYEMYNSGELDVSLVLCNKRTEV